MWGAGVLKEYGVSGLLPPSAPGWVKALPPYSRAPWNIDYRKFISNILYIPTLIRTEDGLFSALLLRNTPIHLVTPYKYAASCIPLRLKLKGKCSVVPIS